MSVVLPGWLLWEHTGMLEQTNGFKATNRNDFEAMSLFIYCQM